MKIVLIFPNQIFENNSLLCKLNKEEDIIYLVEDFLFFRQYLFHKQKLVFHRASLKFYEKYLADLGYKTRYIESAHLLQRKSWGEIILKEKAEHLSVYDPVDTWLRKDLEEFSQKNNIKITYQKNPLFINTSEENKKFFSSQKKPFMKTFYEWQRKRFDILIEDGSPSGGKYSFDTENRKKLPKGYQEKTFPVKNFYTPFVEEALSYVETHFPNNPGETKDFIFATTFSDAQKVLRFFLENNLKDFGVYEDAISQSHSFVNHSLLSPYLNTGLLTPEKVIQEALEYAKDKNNEIPLNSLEGFIRQILGWREFIRAMYEIYGTRMRTSNFFSHTKKLEKTWWTGDVRDSLTSASIIPVNDSIKKVLRYSYTHHIERLMILGNYMILSEYDPHDVYRWFMEMYIDSYDWVMVPNVYGMSQFADGGIFATKPYISASHYIFKMSDYKKIQGEKTWNSVWDSLFWNFLKKHRKFFEKNIRFKMLLSKLPLS
jgi:deoxyribodipyrimidine photolyase-related protein